MVSGAERAGLPVPALKELFAHIPTSVAVITIASGAGRYGQSARLVFFRSNPLWWRLP